MLQIPHTQLRPETLKALIEEFITRHGAVHGQEEISIADQIEQVHKQLEQGRAVILFDETDETWTIVPVERRGE